ncbi:hypothetical protein [Streptomyces sp. NPDC059215]|uniref:hypothetical protein n=1 Tax=Streptomyces sp. NPDC059215 TaxID=3346772 RepID=UPI0036AB68E0
MRFKSTCRGFGMTEARARLEAMVVVDSSLGLLMAPRTDGDGDRAATAFHAGRESTLQQVHPATDPKSAAELFAAIRSGLFRDLEITRHTLLIAILLSCPITL